MATAVADLTESQIDTLLREAEERLAAKNSAAELVASSRPFQVAKAAKREAEAAAASKEVAAQKTDNVAVRIAQLEKKKDKVRCEYVGVLLLMSLLFCPKRSLSGDSPKG